MTAVLIQQGFGVVVFLCPGAARAVFAELADEGVVDGVAAGAAGRFDFDAGIIAAAPDGFAAIVGYEEGLEVEDADVIER
jgi:hypothetical protein